MLLCLLAGARTAKPGSRCPSLPFRGIDMVRYPTILFCTFVWWCDSRVCLLWVCGYGRTALPVVRGLINPTKSVGLYWPLKPHMATKELSLLHILYVLLSLTFITN